MISRTTIWRANQLHHTHHIYYLSNYVVQLSTTIFNFCGSNEPGGIRTLDLRLRRPLLYPAELQTHKTSSLELFLKASGFKKAGDGNRTHVSSLEGWCSTIELHPHACGNKFTAVGVTGFEPAASWSQTRRSSQAEPHPDVMLSCHFFVYLAVTQELLYSKVCRLSTTFFIFFKNFLLPGFCRLYTNFCSTSTPSFSLAYITM